MISWFILVIILSWLQATVLPVDVVTFLMLWALLVWPPRLAWLTVAVLGVGQDLLLTRSLGLSAMIYLGLGLIIWLYRSKFSPFHSVFLSLFTGGSLLVTNWLFSNNWPWAVAIVGGGCMFLLKKVMIERQWEGKLKIGPYNNI